VNGELVGGTKTVNKKLTFQAPSVPGTYRIRLPFVEAFAPVTDFYGGPSGWDVWNPGVGSYTEVSFRVLNPLVQDFFLSTTQAVIAPFGNDRENASQIGFGYVSVPPVVLPGQRVEMEVQWSFLNPANPNAVIYLNAFGDWQPGTELTRFINSELVGGSRTNAASFSFTAPVAPGKYRLRLAFVEAFQAVQNFYGSAPGGVYDPGVGSYVEVAFVVKPVGPANPIGMIVYDNGRELRVLDTARGTNFPVPTPGLGVAANARWSPDGQWIVFNGVVIPHNAQIYKVRPDGSGLTRLTDGSGDLVHPAFSPDGSRIAFFQVYGRVSIIDADGSNRIDLPDASSVCTPPSWSPDGQKLVGTDWGLTYQSDLSIYNLLTGTITKIVQHQGNEAFNYPDWRWSPDGSKIACNRLNPDTGNWDICVMNADGSNRANLTGDWPNSHEVAPKWSPDGQFILFASDRDGNWDSWAMWADGTGRTNLTRSPENEYFPHMALVAPQFTTQPLSQSSSLGGCATFSANVLGSTPLSFQWQFNGVDIPGATSPTLTMCGLTADKAGTYRLRVCNSAGCATSTGAVLSFLDLKMYAGLTIIGSVGSTYRVEACDNPATGNWTAITNITLPSSPYFWLDTESGSMPKRFYRTVPVP